MCLKVLQLFDLTKGKIVVLKAKYDNGANLS